jgi:hypothetical protein
LLLQQRAGSAKDASGELALRSSLQPSVTAQLTLLRLRQLATACTSWRQPAQHRV